MRTVLPYLFLLIALFVGCSEDTKPITDSDGDGRVGDMAIPDMEPDLALPDAAPDMAIPDAAPDMFVQLCENSEMCPPGSECAEGVCTEPECSVDPDCGMFRACREGVCRDQCTGPGTCFRGGICIEGACLPPECEDDAGCEGALLCREGLCVEPQPCADSQECAEDQRCTDGNCEPLGICAGDRNCAEDEICQEGLCRPREGCAAPADCADGEDCVGGRCVPFVCRGDDDCRGDEVCDAGACQEPMEAMVASVVILNRPRTVAVGQQIVFHAVGLDERGDIVVARGFEWSAQPEDGDVISGVIDEGGVFAAGPLAGEVAIVATYAGIASEPVMIRVIEDLPPEGVRVRVVGEVSGGPVGDAVVRVGDLEVVTDADGVAELPEAQPGAPITVFAADYDYVTLLGVGAASVSVVLPPRSDGFRIAGFTGTMDFDQVMSQGDVQLGLAGGSIAGGLTHLDFGALLGELFTVDVNLGPVNFGLPLPGGLTLAARLPVIGQFDLKNDYFAVTEPGFQLAWAFAGRIDIGVLFQLGQGGGGGFNAGRVLSTLLPFFDQFQHGLRVAPELRALPRLPDEDDVDGDGDRDELVPDYERFPVLNQEPAQDQSLRVSVAVPALPENENGSTIALLFAGVEVENVGFVPLGISSVSEAEVVPMRMAPPYGGLEVGTPVVIALSAAFGNNGINLPTDLSAVMRRYPGRIPADVVLDSFLALPESAEFDPALRAASVGAVDGAGLHRFEFRGPSGGWTVYVDQDTAPEVVLPFPPNGWPDLAAAAELRIEAIRLEGDLSLEDLVDTHGPADLIELDARSTGFSRVVP